MSAYIIYHYNITDRSKIDELTRLSTPLTEKYNAEVVIGSPVKTLEGSTMTHIVMLKFSGFAEAQNYFYSDEHKQTSLLRNEITEGWASIVPGDSETQQLVDSGYFETQ